MKPLRFLLAIALSPVCAGAFAQSPATQVALSDPQQSFEMLKSLSGNWRGPVTTDNPAWSTAEPLNISISVASRGNVLVHELKQGAAPELTVFYVENDRVAQIHYCDYGNRSYMLARPSQDAKTVEFDLVSFAGQNKIGHISHAVFALVDANHHVEDWVFTLADGKPVHVRMDLKRVP